MGFFAWLFRRKPKPANVARTLDVISYRPDNGPYALARRPSAEYADEMNMVLLSEYIIEGPASNEAQSGDSHSHHGG